jgi:hypothetical protein
MGGRAIQRAVTRVKSEQAPKVLMRMPTRLHFGEGRVGGEAIDRRTRFDPPGYWARHVGKVIRVIRGDPFWARVAASTSLSGGGLDGSRTGSYDC